MIFYDVEIGLERRFALEQLQVVRKNGSPNQLIITRYQIYNNMK
jgi:hypothetical protein